MLARDRHSATPGRPPTILQIVPRLDTGGAELTTVEITEAIVRAGGRALVVTEGGRMAEQIGERGGTLIPMPAASKNPLTILANARRLAALVARDSVDLVHARSRAPAWSALIAARRTGRPFVTTYHGAYGETNAGKRLYNSVMARGDAVIANSHYTADLIRGRYAFATERITVVHRGVDVAAFAPAAVSPGRVAALRSHWGAADGERVILQAARLTGWKGQRVLIEAAGQLAREQRGGAWVVVLAGDAQGRTGYVEELRALIAAFGLGHRVRLVGHCDDMPAAFCAAHVTVVASTEPEAFGRTAVEAQAMGSPVVATAIGAPPETVLAAATAADEAITGWLVPPHDATALAGCLLTALTMSEPERVALGARARAHVSANFSLAAMQRATLAVYDHLLGSTLAAALWT